MFFKSKKRKLQEVSENMFPEFIAELKNSPEDALGELLDGALGIKLASVNMNAAIGSDDEAKAIYSDPLSLNTNTILQQLEIMQLKIAEFAMRGRLDKIAMLSVWYLSLSALVFDDQLHYGKQLWKELSRGLSSCNHFDQKEDLIKGLEP